ncbi:MAG: hypothetical protein ABR600_10175 [Actinomycetota bacterium]
MRKHEHHFSFAQAAKAEAELSGWFAGRVPAEWFDGAPAVTVDREEVLIVGTLSDVDLGSDAGEDALAGARSGRVQGFREDTREARMRIAREAERRFDRKVSWGVRIGDQERLFTNASVPVMTRLRMPERQVLDTLIDAGVARSRSEALAWCVKLVGTKQSEWIEELRQSLEHVQRAREAGPNFA